MVMGTVAGLGLAASAGCARYMTVDVRNLTDQPVSVEIMRGRGVIAARARVGPGDRESIGPARVPFLQRAFAVLDFEGNVGYPIRHRLRRTLTVLNVVRPADEGARGGLVVDEVEP